MRQPTFDGLEDLPQLVDVVLRRLEGRSDLAFVGLDGVGQGLRDVDADAQAVGGGRVHLKRFTKLSVTLNVITDNIISQII